jgi:hypothetical protein
VALAGAAAAAVLLAAVLVAPSGAPTVEDAAAFATAPATAPAPAADGPLLDITQDGIPFPAWAEKFGWEATGSRTDELDGRSTTTVFYEKDGKRLAYTIVGGDALDKPGGNVITAEGTPVTVFGDDGRLVATWERDGNTCVLSGEGIDEQKLAELAGWTGKGAVAF